MGFGPTNPGSNPGPAANRAQFMESPRIENPKQTAEERLLSQEILGKIDELLDADGGEVDPSKIAKYGFDLSNQTIGGKKTLPEGIFASEVSCGLTLNRTPAEGQAQKTTILIRIFDKGNQELSFTLFFPENKSSFFQYGEDPKKTGYDHIPREATVEDLGDFLDILEKPLYLIG